MFRILFDIKMYLHILNRIILNVTKRSFFFFFFFFFFFSSSGRVDTAVRMRYLDAYKTAGEETRWQLHKNVASNIEHVLVATPHKAPTIQPPASDHENYKS